jgi:hypothetical protein
MTARSIRRAMERKTQKLEKKRLLANQANASHEAAILSEPKAQKTLSTGPRTAAGKAVSSLNAVKTALTGRTVLLPADDAAEYERHLAAYVEEFAPVGLLESNLAQSIADTDWRLRRIPALESALFAKGRLEFAEMFDEQELAARPHLIDAHTFITYEKQIRNLQLQEARLARRREKEIAELRNLQTERIQKQQNEKTRKPAIDGFVFSTAPIEPEQAFAADSCFLSPDSCLLTPATRLLSEHQL